MADFQSRTRNRQRRRSLVLHVFIQLFDVKALLPPPG